MIIVKVGDLLEADEDIIVHQVNAQAKMGSGIALQVKNKFPKAYQEYMVFATKNKGNPQVLGEVLISVIKPNKYLAHLFGQLNYGYDGHKYTSYDALYTGLKYIKYTAKAVNKSVAIPWKLGSDRGGADWDVVYKMIDKIFHDYQVTLYKLEEL